ncbi:MAG: MFS transporter, partial [Planctomycetota bacterium]
MSTAEDPRAYRNVAVLVAAQAFLGSQITMVFVIGGLAGTVLSPYACLVTLPISLIVFGSMTTAPWLSPLMQRAGRRTGFLVGAAGGLVGSGISAYALTIDNFWVFLVGSYFTGIYMSSQGFFRFAATDTASDAFKPKAISYVMAGGLISALIGPQIVGYMTANNPDATAMRYFDIYMVAMGLNVLGMLLFFLLDIPKPPLPSATDRPARSKRALLSEPRILVAVICGAVSYALMNLVMTSTPLAVVACGYSEPDAANVVT